MDFTQLCTATPAEYETLRQQIALCAVQGHSYEFSALRLPGGCQPEEATLGFSLQDGKYLLYWQPAVTYQGQNRVLAILFSRSQWRFDTFADMSRWLRSLEPAVRDAAIPLRTTEIPLFPRLRQTLEETVLGQPEAVEAAAFRLAAHVGKQSPARPLSLIFYGPTGVGKSELGKAIAPALRRWSGKDYRFVWTELNTFTQPHSVHRLTGAPPGYVGYEDQPIFEAVRQDPRTVFMFDELEKAHPEVLKVFMSILDEGRCTAHRVDEEGERELDFRRCVFIFTTNADLSRGKGRQLGFSDPPPAVEKTTAAGPAALAQRLFKENEQARQSMVSLGVLPEIAGRFSGIIGFHQLDETARQAITAKQIQALGREYGLRIVTVEPALVRALTPRQDALSVRSAVCVLEGLLSPLFAQAARDTPLRLTGTPEAPRLASAYPMTSTTVPSSCIL